MFGERHRFKIKSESLQCETTIGVIIPKKIEKFCFCSMVMMDLLGS